MKKLLLLTQFFPLTVFVVIARMKESALFASILIVGTATTLYASHGFIEVPHSDRKLIVKYSVYLIAITIICTVLALLFRSNILLAGVLPFILLIICRKLLQKRLLNRVS